LKSTRSAEQISPTDSNFYYFSENQK